MTGKIGRKKVLKFRDFPTRLHGEVFFVENGYDEKLNLSIINHLLDINNLFISKSIHFNYFPFLGPHIRKTALYSYPAMNKEDLNISVPSDLLLSQLVEEKNKGKGKKTLIIAGGIVLTAVGFIVIPRLLDKYANKAYKFSLKKEEIDFDNMGPEIVPSKEKEDEESGD